ncbi:MAG: hypothetical protein FWC79_06135 [Oscillospiraceae bacterium]|nr:hypothetical protein [Oscillospiraceae bacterium]
MLNSILMVGSTYSKNKKANIVFAILWIVFMLMGSNLTTGLVFTIMNIMAFATVFALGQLFKGKYSNKTIAIFSVLIWSIVIDIICYFLFPQFVMGQSIFTYISGGIAFNYRYVFMNTIVVGVLTAVPAMSKRISAYKNRNQLQAVKTG